MKEEKRKNSAVSPVIGVVLLVAITVLLAAVVGTTVAGFSDSVEPPEYAVIEVTDVEVGPGGTNDEVTVQLLESTGIRNDHLYLSFGDTQIQHEDGSATAGPENRLSWRELSQPKGGPLPPKKTIGVGEEVMFEPPNSPLSNERVEGREVSVVYDNGDSSFLVDEIGPLPSPG